MSMTKKEFAKYIIPGTLIRFRLKEIDGLCLITTIVPDTRFPVHMATFGCIVSWADFDQAPCAFFTTNSFEFIKTWVPGVGVVLGESC